MNKEEKIEQIKNTLRDDLPHIGILPVLADVMFDIEMIKQQLKLLGDILSGLLPPDMVKELNDANK